MNVPPLYHVRSRELQDQFDTRRLADRLVERLVRTRFTEEDRAFIARQSLFFLATADAEGYPDCSYKGGAPGFVRVLDDSTLAFPSYDGNGMFKSLGNIRSNPRVGLLFLNFEKPQRLRVNGTASVDTEDPLLSSVTGAQAIVRVQAQHIFPNCPRYIHRMQLVERSPYVPVEGVAPPIPAWKTLPEFKEVLPPADPARTEDE
ncbi:MAG: pyridoxamine 5'-phosphate oxidase [Candidatus Muproteobacteria bacterium RBG_16_60_9]|uniref:Pyridoxamine 5'-phosphate oxidase n=1 Tax=Candidatus Muproteobacteria bacterium RBG_16_60_9 TaxID=1817755 RepID=A0A1F6V9X5_9PROT|nr:MAG: pyridoxamine 5'-phosphate oxidase [Candidatus Muproteobacteria bacterium RBG_16_60_9]